MTKTGSQLTAHSRQLRQYLYRGLLAFALLQAWPAVIGAQTSVEAYGGVESPFELGGSARSLGMGGTSVAITGEGDNFFGNPAILATLDRSEILTFHSPLFIDTIYDSLGFTHPVASDTGFGLAVSRLGTSNINQTINNIQAVSTFSSQQLEGLVSYGFRLVDALDLGASVKYVNQQIDNYQGSGVGVDLGLLYPFSTNPRDLYQIGYKNLTVGFMAENVLQPQTRLFQALDEPIQVFHPALSYLFRPSAKDSFWLTFEGEIPEGAQTLFKAGAEYGLNDMIFVRAGFDGYNPTAGAGLKMEGFEFDYAFNQSPLGALNRFSLTYQFGVYRDPLQAQRIDLLKWAAKSYTKNNDYDPAIQSWKNVLNEFPNDPEAAQAVKDLQEKKKAAIRSQLEAAKTAMAKNDFDRALPLLAKVMSLDPGNREAKALLNQVDKKMLLSTDYVRGVEAYGKEDYATAVQYLGMVYQLDTHYRDVYFLYHDAQSHYLPLESMSKDLTALYAKGVNYYMNGDYGKAIGAWEKVLEKDPKNFLVQRNLAEAHERLQEKPADGASAGTGK